MNSWSGAHVTHKAPEPEEGLVPPPTLSYLCPQPRECSWQAPLSWPHPDGMYYHSPPHNQELRPLKPLTWLVMTPPTPWMFRCQVSATCPYRRESPPHPAQVGPLHLQLNQGSRMFSKLWRLIQCFFYSIMTAYPIFSFPLKYPPVPQVVSPSSHVDSGGRAALTGRRPLSPRLHLGTWLEGSGL